jgi:hypothetical protein
LPDFPSDIKDPKEAPGANFWPLDSRIKTSQSALRASTKVSRDFDVIQLVPGPLPDCFLSTLQILLLGSSPV